MAYNCHASWTPGTEAVTGQEYRWSVNGSIAATGNIGPTINAADSAADGIQINHGDTVEFGVLSTNQWNKSDEATASGVAPTPTPQAPSGVSLSFSEVGGIPT